MTNAYDLVSTVPMAMLRHDRPLTEENDIAIVIAAKRAHNSGGTVIAGWGKHCRPARQADLMRTFSDIGVPLWCLGINLDGTPKHPLYTAYNTALLEFRLAL